MKLKTKPWWEQGMQYDQIEAHLEGKRSLDDKLDYLWRIRSRRGLLLEITALKLDNVIKEVMFSDLKGLYYPGTGCNSYCAYPPMSDIENARKVKKVIVYMQDALKKGEHEKYNVLLAMAREQYAQKPTLEVLYAQPYKSDYIHGRTTGEPPHECDRKDEHRATQWFHKSAYNRDMLRYFEHNTVMRMIISDYNAKKEIEDRHKKLNEQMKR